MTREREHFRIEEVASGIHAAVATADGFGLCNAGIVDLGGATVVFDAMLTPQAGEALGLAARRLTGRPVDLLVDSHHHGDHVRGNGAVGAQHIVSTHRVRELIVERATATLESDRAEVGPELEGLRSGRIPASAADRTVLEGWYEGILATPPNLKIAPPDLTIAEELVVRGTRREARILSFGGGHSPSDVFVHLPDDGILLLGDLLSNGFHPSLSDGNPEELLRILHRVEALGATRMLPGHGPVSGPADLRRMVEYVELMLRWGRERRALGAAAEPPGNVRPPPPFDSWKLGVVFTGNLAFVSSRPAPGA